VSFVIRVIETSVTEQIRKDGLYMMTSGWHWSVISRW